jgi:hypothetical protein
LASKVALLYDKALRPSPRDGCFFVFARAGHVKGDENDNDGDSIVFNLTSIPGSIVKCCAIKRETDRARLDEPTL